MTEKTKRLGKMLIEAEMVEDPLFPEILAHIGFVPYRVEFLFHSGQFEYIGYSKRFDAIPRISVTPEYALEIETALGGITAIQVRRV